MRVTDSSRPLVAIVMGSDSDRPKVAPAAETLEGLGIAHEVHVASAHRTPDRAVALARGARERGIRVIIAAAGSAAHLAGVLAAHTTLPVIGLPIASGSVATVAINGAKNAALLAAEILATTDGELEKKLAAVRKEMAAEVEAAEAKLKAGGQ